MARKHKRLNRISAFVTMSVLFFASDVAMAQAINADACMEVPSNVRKISAALNICGEVRSLTQRQLSVQELAAEPNLKASETVRAAIATTPEIFAQSRLPVLDLANQNHKWTDKWLKISAIIIGGVGAGAGGALRLVNDKTIQHDGTVVGMVGGLTGAGVNLLDNVCFANDKRNTHNQFMRLPPPVREYIKEANVQEETFCRHPSKLSALLTEMSAETSALQDYLK